MRVLLLLMLEPAKRLGTQIADNRQGFSNSSGPIVADGMVISGWQVAHVHARRLLISAMTLTMGSYFGGLLQ
ncbi:MAG: hypothetical protein Ct9H90mP25_0710 [Gammaproteobacteria bacterium]|nr:MAG: hypothetical protein Ct9H90mP25_0710 [Gammaproteobacteria bacterium]